MTVYFIGSGPGAADLLTVRAARLIARCGTCLYTGGDVTPEVIAACPPAARVVDTDRMPIEEAVAEMRAAHARGDDVAHLHPADPSASAAVGELISALDAGAIPWEIVPGVPAAPSPRPAIEPSPPPRRAPSSPPGRILVLGGTSEGRQLADLLDSAGLDVVTSLADRLSRPRQPRGEIRVGGFGGPDGLARWLVEHDVSAVIDASHPFADRISTSAARACAGAGVPLLRLHRRAWEPGEGDDWIHVPDPDAAAEVVRERFRRPMLRVGGPGLAAFAGDSRGSYLIRSVEPPTAPLPHRYLLVLDRGPSGADSERTLMARHRIDVLVTENSGGEATESALAAARDLRIPVVMIERPEAPDAETVHSVDDAARWIVERFGGR